MWLHLQDEEATEAVPKQLQSWLTGQETQQRKEFKRNRRHHSFANGLDRDLLCTTYHSSRSQTRISQDHPDQPGLDGGLGRDERDRMRQIEGHLKATKTLDENSQTPCAPFLDMFGLNERVQNSQGLELLEVAMWVALTQHQTGRKFLFEQSCICVVMEYADGLSRNWTRRSDAHNSGSVCVGDDR